MERMKIENCGHDEEQLRYLTKGLLVISRAVKYEGAFVIVTPKGRIIVGDLRGVPWRAYYARERRD